MVIIIGSLKSSANRIDYELISGGSQAMGDLTFPETFNTCNPCQDSRCESC